MRTTSSADSLFPKTRQGILAATFINPEKWWYFRELARHLRQTPSSLQREVQSLVRGGILKKKEEGKHVYFRPETRSPIYPELRGIVLKTVGLVDVLRRHLSPFEKKIDYAFVYGSVARAEEQVGSDVDLMVVGEVSLVALSPILRKAEEVLTRPINVNIYTKVELSKKVKSKRHFVSAVMKSEKLFLIGNENALVKAVRK